jgi:hypothetical protein
MLSALSDAGADFLNLIANKRAAGRPGDLADAADKEDDP